MYEINFQPSLDAFRERLSQLAIMQSVCTHTTIIPHNTKCIMYKYKMELFPRNFWLIYKIVKYREKGICQLGKILQSYYHYSHLDTCTSTFQFLSPYLSNWSCNTWWLAYQRGSKLLNVPFQGRMLEITTRFNGTPVAVYYGAVASRDP